MAVIGEGGRRGKRQAMELTRYHQMNLAAWYIVPTTCTCRYTQLLMASCTAAAESSSNTVAAVCVCVSHLPHQTIYTARYSLRMPLGKATRQE